MTLPAPAAPNATPTFAQVTLNTLAAGYYTLSLTAGGSTTLSSLAVIAGHGTAFTSAYTASRILGTTIHPLTHPTVDHGPLAAQLNLSTVRMDMRWENVEKTAGVYTFDDVTSNQISSLTGAGVKVSVILGYYNPLYDSGRTPSTPAGIAAFADYAEAVAQQYGGFVDYEVYNEPNIGTNTSLCGASAACYIQLVAPAVAKIRAVEPAARIIGPSLGGLTNYWVGSSPSAYTWMQDFLNQGGLNYVDVIAMHNYATPNAPEGGSAAAVAAVRSLIDSYPGGSSKQLWLGETGWPTTGASKGAVDEDQQAKYMVRDIAMVAAAGAAQYMVYDLVDDYADPINPEGHFGLIRNETVTRGALVPKPSWVAYEVLARQLDGYSYSGKDTIATGVYSYRFTNSSGTVKRIMWAPAGASVTAAVSASPVVTEYLGTARTVVREGGKVQLQLTDEPIFLSGATVTAFTQPTDTLPVSVAPSSLQFVAIPVTVKVDNTGISAPPTGAVTFTASTGQTVTLASTANAVTTGTLTIPAFSDTGNKRVTVTATRGGQLIAVRYASTTVTENPVAYLIPLTTAGASGSGAAVLRIAYGTSASGVTVSSVNWSIGTLSGTLTPNTAFTAGVANITLPAAGLPLWKPQAYTVSFTLSDGRTKTITGSTAFAPSYVQGAANTASANLLTAGTWVTAGGATAGAADLSGSMTVTHDATNVYVRATITDNIQTAGPDAASLYLGDSIQFGFLPGIPIAGATVTEFGAALIGTTPTLYRYSGTQGIVTAGAVTVTRNATAKTTTYVITLPYTEIGIAPGDPIYGYSFLVNDNDGTGRKGFIEWGSGIGASKDPSVYLPVQQF